MRWKVKPKLKPYHLQERIITKFALLPIQTEDGEVRWLERVTVNRKRNQFEQCVEWKLYNHKSRMEKVKRQYKKRTL